MIQVCSVFTPPASWPCSQHSQCTFTFFASLIQRLTVFIGEIFKIELIQLWLSSFDFILLCLCQQGWGVPSFVTGLFFSSNVKHLYRVIVTFNLFFSQADNSWNPPSESLFFSGWCFVHEYLFSELSPADCTAFLKWGFKAEHEKFLPLHSFTFHIFKSVNRYLVVFRLSYDNSALKVHVEVKNKFLHLWIENLNSFFSFEFILTDVLEVLSLPTGWKSCLLF